MLYAAMTFWLLIIVLSAAAVISLWGGLVRPRYVNALLLPGTIIAQIGHVLGLLLTGAEINNTRLAKDDDTGEPATSPNPQPKIPIIGPILIALFPMVACGLGVYVVLQAGWAPGGLRSSNLPVTSSLPISVAGAWDLLRDAVTLTERLFNRILRSNWLTWQTWAFFYLLICMTVRMAPLPGNLRGAIGAIVLLGVLAAVVGSFWPDGRAVILDSWPILSFTVACLLLLLVLSLVARGIVELVRLVAKRS